MNRNQMITYLSEQIRSVGDELAIANKSGNKLQVELALANLRKRVQYLRGYATALEHVGWLSREDADATLGALEHI